MSSDTATLTAQTAILAAIVEHHRGHLSDRALLTLIGDHEAALDDPDTGTWYAWGADAEDVDRNEVAATELQPGEVREGYQITPDGWLRDYRAVGAGVAA